MIGFKARDRFGAFPRRLTEPSATDATSGRDRLYEIADQVPKFSWVGPLVMISRSLPSNARKTRWSSPDRFGDPLVEIPGYVSDRDPLLCRDRRDGPLMSRGRCDR